jgi:hypothetical protein
MSDALLKAGLITADAKQKAEYEMEAKRIFVLHEKGGTTFSKDDLDQLSKEVAREALRRKTPLSDLGRLVMDAVHEHKVAIQQANRISTALESPRRVTGVLTGVGERMRIFSVNPRALARGMKS